MCLVNLKLLVLETKLQENLKCAREGLIFILFLDMLHFYNYNKFKIKLYNYPFTIIFVTGSSISLDLLNEIGFLL